MNRARHLVIATGCLFVLGSGCKKDDEPARADLGYEYFPTDTGLWINYTVDSAWVSPIPADNGAITYPLREKITEDFTDFEGRPAQRLIRYAFDSAAMQWAPKDVWWQVRDAVRAERSEENLRRVKLIFPPRTGQYWNTNATNSTGEFELTYQEVDVPWSVNGMSFDSTILVKTTYPNNLVVNRTYYERYAKHIGLVYRQADSSNTQPGGSDPGTTGTFYKQVITGYGH